MHLLQIFNLKTLQVPLRGLHTGMAEDFGEIEQIPPSPQVAHREGVPERMRRTADSSDGESGAKLLEITLKIADTHYGSIARAEDQIFFIPHITKQCLPQLKRHWHEPLLLALAHNADHEIVKINICSTQVKYLADPKSGIQN